jgi:hypothetical protein
MRSFKGECEHFSFNKCPLYTHDGASAKFSTNSHETDYSVVWFIERELFLAYLVFHLFQSLVCSADQDKQKYLAMYGK